VASPDPPDYWAEELDQESREVVKTGKDGGLCPVAERSLHSQHFHNILYNQRCIAFSPLLGGLRRQIFTPRPGQFLLTSGVFPAIMRTLAIAIHP